MTAPLEGPYINSQGLWFADPVVDLTPTRIAVGGMVTDLGDAFGLMCVERPSGITTEIRLTLPQVVELQRRLSDVRSALERTEGSDV